MQFATVNPYTGQTVKTFDFATDAQIDAALAKAHETFLAAVRRSCSVLPTCCAPMPGATRRS